MIRLKVKMCFVYVIVTLAICLIACSDNKATNNSKTLISSKTNDSENHKKQQRTPSINHKNNALRKNKKTNQEKEDLSRKMLLNYTGLRDLDPEKSYLIMVKSETCMASASMEEALESIKSLPVEVIKIDLSDVNEMFVFSTPWLWLYDGGKIIDGSRGAIVKPSHNWKKNNIGIVMHLLARNSVGDIHRPSLKKFNDPIISRKGKPNSGVENRDMSGLDMTSYEFNNSILSGSSFKESNLKNADLSGTLIINANFKNANLKGANLDGVYWENVVCPDGSSSNENGFKCIQ